MVPQESVLISDSKILAISVLENKESLVDLLEQSQIFVDRSRERVQQISSSISKVRKTVAQKLLEAQNKLPYGIKLKVKECYRPISVQRVIFGNYINQLKKAHNDWSSERLYAEASRFVAPPEAIPPHSTGGAVDLTLMTNDGEELNMGTPVNAKPEDCDNACNTLAKNISQVAGHNRQMLIEAMSAVGFVNYPTEWWHWSYGDRYWAYHTENPYAVYGAI